MSGAWGWGTDGRAEVTLSAWWAAAGPGAQTMQAAIVWYDAQGGAISTSLGSAVAMSGSYKRVYVTAVAPGGAAFYTAGFTRTDSTHHEVADDFSLLQDGVERLNEMQQGWETADDVADTNDLLDPGYDKTQWVTDFPRTGSGHVYVIAAYTVPKIYVCNPDSDGDREFYLPGVSAWQIIPPAA